MHIRNKLLLLAAAFLAFAGTLRDIMGLLPGATITNPDLSSAHSISLRTANASIRYTCPCKLYLHG